VLPRRGGGATVVGGVPHSARICTATVQTPDKTQASGVIVKTVIYTPAGVTGPALGITLQ
jgi:hypothetical protein